MSDNSAFRTGLTTRPRPDSLADVLERVLDKGVVIAGDVVVNVLDIELLTLKVRLLVCSVDTAQEIGLDWWKHDPFLTGQQPGNGADGDGRRRLTERLERLEARLDGAREHDHGD